MAGAEWGGPSPWRSKVQFVHLTNKYLEEQYRTLYMVLYLKLGVRGDKEELGGPGEAEGEVAGDGVEAGGEAPPPAPSKYSTP